MAITFEIGNKLSDDERNIRTAVFIEEQKFKEEFDGIDADATHIVLYYNNKPAACCRFFRGSEPGEYCIGRVAVMKEHRGKGLGRIIMQKAEEIIARLAGTRIVASAQLRVSEFYEELGYTKKGGIYLDEYCEHIRMEKNLT